MDKEIYLASNEGLNINFVHKGKSYRVYVDAEIGLVSTYEIFESKNDKLVNMYDLKSNRESGEEYMTVGDYCKVYDMLICTKEDFLNSYSYIDEDSYNLSFEIAMDPVYLANLTRQAENLFQMETEQDREEIEYMQEAGTDYISSADWKWAIQQFIAKNYDREQFYAYEDTCQSMAC